MGVVIDSEVPGSGKKGVWFYLLPAVRPWASNLTSLCLAFLMHKMSVINYTVDFKWKNAHTSLIHNSSININYHFYRSSGPLSQKSLLQQPWQLNIWSLLACFLRQEVQGFLGNVSCITIPKSQQLNQMYVHLLLMSQPSVVNTPGDLSIPPPAPSLWWLCLLPGPSQGPLLASPLPAGQEAKKKVGEKENIRCLTSAHPHLPELWHMAPI